MIKIDPRIYTGKPTLWVKFMAIIMASCAVSVVLLYGARFCLWVSDKTQYPVKWVVFAAVSFVFTLIIGPLHEVKNETRG